MKQLGLKTIDVLVTLFCSIGPFKAIGNWWWRKRLSPVHDQLEMETYLSRSQMMRSM